MAITRSQQKEITRRTIIDAAIKQISAEKSFASLSLREVTREAKIAPTSFYHHFKNMEELGLVLIDESGLALRQVMRKARQRFEKGDNIIESSVNTFMEFTETAPNIFRILFHERSGTTDTLRTAVSREIQYFIVELTDFIQAFGYEKEAAYSQAEAMVAIIFNTGAESLDLEPNQRSALYKRAIQQLRYIAAGARHYHSKKTKAPRNFAE